MSTVRELRELLVEVSRRHSRVAHEVEDLAHDILLSALRRGAILEGEEALRQAHGAARRHGAFLARSAGRRRAREACCASDEIAPTESDAGDASGGAPVSVLSPALRTTLFLLVAGLEKEELRAALGVTDAALRKRFQALREHGPLARPGLPVPERTPASSQTRRSQIGLLPRLTAPTESGSDAGRALAVSDPDGHGIIFAEVLTPGGPAATLEASTVNDRTRSKGTSCSTDTSKTSPSSSS